MSGKKKSEVVTVLKNADETRKDIFEKKFGNIDIAKNNFDSVKKEFSSSSTNIEVEMKDMKNLKSKVKTLNSEIKKLEKKISQKAKQFENWSEEDFDDEFYKAENIIDEYQTIASDVTSIERKINRKRDDLLKAKELKDQAIKQQSFINDKINNISYENPIDYKKKMNLSELCSKFLDEIQSYSEISTLQKEISTQIKAQKYEKAISTTSILNEKIIVIEEKIQANIIKTKENLQTAFAIEDVLADAGYEYSSELIDGKLSQGIRIKTINNNDLEFNLSNIVVHDEEKIDIDFVVNDTNEGCSITTIKLQKSLYEKGIPFKITDWGTASQSRTKTTNTYSNNTKVKK